MEAAQHSRLKWQEIASLILAVASMSVDNTVFVGTCLLLTSILGCWGIITHYSFNVAIKIVVCLAIIELSFGLFLYLRSSNIEKALHQLQGTLVAGSGQRKPQNYCNIPADAVVMEVGGGSAFSTKDGPINVISSSNEVILAVERKTYNFIVTKLTVMHIRLLDIWDDLGQNIVHISQDAYWVSPISRLERSSLGDMTVFDYSGKEVFKIDYVNANTIRIRGILRLRKKFLAQITDDELILPNNGRMTRWCSGDAIRSLLRID